MVYKLVKNDIPLKEGSSVVLFESKRAAEDFAKELSPGWIAEEADKDDVCSDSKTYEALISALKKYLTV